jgi:hypothetical protein
MSDFVHHWLLLSILFSWIPASCGMASAQGSTGSYAERGSQHAHSKDVGQRRLWITAGWNLLDK